MGTLNVNALRGRVCEVWETFFPQESGYLLYSGDHILWWQLPHNQGQGLQVQVYRSGNNKGTASVGVFVAKEWIEKVSEVQSYTSFNFCRNCFGKQE